MQPIHRNLLAGVTSPGIGAWNNGNTNRIIKSNSENLNLRESEAGE